MSSQESDVDDIDLESLKTEIQHLSEQLKVDPFAYDAHVRRVKLLRAAKEYSLLHDARELMAESFPLTPELWLEWLEDERALLKEGDSRDPIENLFKRALNDYQSVDVWLEYCHFAIGEIAASGDLDRTRSVLESALLAQGLNFRNGYVLFEIYREFEKVCLVQLQCNKADEATIEEQVKKIDSIYRRHLAVPHIDLDSTMEEYQDFLDGSEPSSSCIADFEAAKKKWEALEKFELEISDIKEDQEDEEEKEGEPKDQSALFTAWQNYLNYSLERATRKGTKANIKKAEGTSEVTITPLEMICLYERAITDLCLYADIWQQAADYLEIYVSADQQRLIDILKRSVRNVTWSSDLWCRYARAVETKALSEFAHSSANGNQMEESSTYNISKEFDPVRQVFENALCNAFSTPNELTAVWMGYCDFLLRLIHNFNNPQIKERSIKMLRDNFQRAQTHISLAFPKNAEQEFPIYRYWAFVEAKFLGDIERSRELWKTMLKDGHNGNNNAFWISYLEFLKNHDDVNNLLRVAGMAVNSVTGNYAETVFVTARRCLTERALDLARLKEFDAKVTLRRNRLKSTSNTAQTDNDAGNDSQHQRKSENSSNAQQQEKSPKSGKRKAECAVQNIEPHSKRSKLTAPDGDTVAGKWSNCTDEGAGDRPKHGETVVHDPTKDDRTVFISNLPFVTTEDELKVIFQKVGEVVSIRLVRDYAGKSKGFGYVEFLSPDQAASALELDRTPINTNTAKGVIGRPMFVSVCDTNRSKTSGFHYSTGFPEPKKLFVKNLDKVVSEEALKTFFGQHGKVVSVRLATFRNGVPKGHAYVEFATEEEASRALTATDGAQIGSKAISVAISNPPPRSNGSGNQQSQSTHHQQQQSTSKSSTNPTVVRSTAHTQLAFMPRALHRTAGGSKEKPSTSTVLSDSTKDAAATSPPKSNADFRKMFLKQ
nr:squamous cell carcinoma antigen [Hymenolepis microstoma]